MFSYRHAFHAGNHADVLKHIVLLAVLRHMTLKETALTVFDTHAGAGLYRLDGDYAKTSGEAGQGFLRLVSAEKSLPVQAGSARVAIKNEANEWAPLIQDYLDMVAGFNTAGSHRVYPGSPFLIQRLLRERDRLKLFELHPTDARTLAANIAQLEAGRQVAVLQEDGFEGLKKFLPPPARRALVLSDPSYEIKSDYARVVALVADSLQRFSTGTYVVWYPIIPRPEAHDLPKRLRTLANQSQKPWLNATLAIGRGPGDEGGLVASGMFVINPPFTLKDQIRKALDVVGPALARGSGKNWAVESS